MPDPSSERLALPVELASAVGPTLHRIADALAPAEVVELTPAWATIELDRAEREMGSTEGSPDPPSPTDLPDDRVLGSRTRRLASDGHTTLLLEPSTEGRIASALARRGEGWAAVYVSVDGADDEVLAARLAAGGVMLSSAAAGPLGPERLVLGGPRDGPFVLVVVRGP